MNRIRAFAFAAAVAAAITLPASAASAAGTSADAAQLSPTERTQLLAAIAAFKVAHPEAFEAVANVKGHRPEGYSDRRNPIPEVGRELAALGPNALLPMLNALAFEAPARGALTDAEWTALQVGLLEAVGSLRDARSGSVLRAAHAEATEPHVQRAAAEAIGMLCDGAALAHLVARTGPSDALRVSSIEGLGQCRRVESAKHLAALVDAPHDDASAKALARALGAVGSAWAWQAMGPSAAASGAVVRDLASAALVRGFVARTGEARLAMQKGLLMVAHEGAASRLQAARATADAATQKAIDGLSRQMARKISR